MPSAHSVMLPPRPVPTKSQRRGFLAAWGGWTLDGMDSSIYALALVPALGLLVRSRWIAGKR
jgi:hypothetical protein